MKKYLIIIVILGHLLLPLNVFANDLESKGGSPDIQIETQNDEKFSEEELDVEGDLEDVTEEEINKTKKAKEEQNAEKKDKDHKEIFIYGIAITLISGIIIYFIKNKNISVN
jgi:hypothetical protein